MSGTIGLDDPTVWERTAVYNLAYGLNAVGTGGNAYAGVHAPDIVGNIRVDQAWGLFQISAAAHEVSGSYDFLNGVAVPAGAQGPAGAAPTALSEIGGHPDTKWGGSVMAALQIKNIPTGAGDDIKIDASYALGDTKNVIATSGTSPNFAMFGSTGNAAAPIRASASARPLTLSGSRTTPRPARRTRRRPAEADGSLWRPRCVQPQLGSVLVDQPVRQLFGGPLQGHRRRPDLGQGPILRGLCHRQGRQRRLLLQPGLQRLAARLDRPAGPPVKNLTFSAEVQWFHLDQKYAGAATFGPAAPKPTTVYEFKDQDTVLLQLRAQRNF